MDSNMVPKAVNWIGLILSCVFIVIGLGILSGLILSGSFFLARGVRALVGIVLVGYGIVRGSMTYRRIRSIGKEENRE